MAVTRSDFWSAERWERVAPLSGVVAVLLFVVGLIIREQADRPNSDGPAEAFVTYLQNEDGPILGGTFVMILGFLAFLWFLGSLRSRLMAAEGGVSRVAAIAFGAGISATVLALAGLSIEVSGVIATDDDGRLDPGAAQALAVGGDGVLYASFFPSGLLVLATAVVVLRTRVFPRWVAWVSLVLAVALILPWVNWFAWLFLFPLWIILLSVWMWRPFGVPGMRSTTSPPPAA